MVLFSILRPFGPRRATAMLRAGTLRRIAAHPNICHVHDCYFHNSQFHLVLDYCAGGPLFDRIEKQSHYSEQQARFAFAQVTEAIGHCHLHGVVHRDLKPENVLYVDVEGTPNGEKLKVCDFGADAASELQGRVDGVIVPHRPRVDLQGPRVEKSSRYSCIYGSGVARCG